MKSRSIQIYLDGPNDHELDKFIDICDGLTFNPSLFTKLGVKNYIDKCVSLSLKYPEKPISLEVVSDNHKDMLRQARTLSEISTNVWVKIPIMYTNADSTEKILLELLEVGIKINLTAILSYEQCLFLKRHKRLIKPDNLILSVFAGRLSDIGIDAPQVMSDFVKRNNDEWGVQVLWASTRQVYDIVLAEKAGCDIITVSSNIIEKLALFGKNPIDYSLDTVKMFLKDAEKSGYYF